MKKQPTIAHGLETHTIACVFHDFEGFQEMTNCRAAGCVEMRCAGKEEARQGFQARSVLFYLHTCRSVHTYSNTYKAGQDGLIINIRVG